MWILLIYTHINKIRKHCILIEKTSTKVVANAIYEDRECNLFELGKYFVLIENLKILILILAIVPYTYNFMIA